jgi:trigger factor
MGEITYYDDDAKVTYETEKVWTRAEVDELIATYKVVCDWSADGAYGYLEQKLSEIVDDAWGATIIDFDIKKAFPNDTEISSLLKIEKEQVADMGPNFRLTVKVVKDYAKAELNQEFYNKCFGDNAVKNEEEFKNRVIEDIQASFARETKYKMMLDIKEKIVEKLGLSLPEEFLKRWIIATNKDINDEQLNEEFPRFIKDLQWTLIKGKIAKENDLKVEEEQLKSAAKQQLLAQFSQYGMSYIPDEYLDKYAEEMLSKEEEANKLYEQEIEDVVVSFIAEAIKTEEKEVTFDIHIPLN